MDGRTGSLVVRALVGLLLVSLLLGFLLHLFLGRIGSLEDRRNSLLLAGQIFASRFSGPAPEVGVHDSTAVLGGEVYSIRRIVYEVSPDIIEMRMLIGGDDDAGVQLVRRFYDDGSY